MSAAAIEIDLALGDVVYLGSGAAGLRDVGEDAQEAEDAQRKGRREPKHTVQEVISQFGEAYIRHGRPDSAGQRLLFDILCCKTAALGGHRYRCPSCGHTEPRYNPCHNRSCPNCQAAKTAEWVEKQMVRMLPIGHYHVVFTVPEEVRTLVYLNKKKLAYRELFRCAWETIDGLAGEYLDGARLGVTMIVHTWSRKMVFHPHVHCIVSCGGLSRDGERWIPTGEKFLFPIDEMRNRFRDALVARLRRLEWLGVLEHPTGKPWDAPNAFAKLCEELESKSWIANVQAPLQGPRALTRYLGQYTHRIAISDWRILSVDDESVCITTRDDNSVTLTGQEFISRFLLHIPPARARRVHHFGLYSGVGGRLYRARALALAAPHEPPPEVHPDESWEQRVERLTGVHPLTCPACGDARMEHEDEIEPLANLLPFPVRRRRILPRRTAPAA